MQLDMNTNRMNLRPEFREIIGGELDIAFRSLEGHIAGITIHLSDINGPRGGVCKRCRIVVDTAKLGPIIVRQTENDFHRAVTNAIDIAANTLRRRITKRRHVKRQPGTRKRQESEDLTDIYQGR